MAAINNLRVSTKYQATRNGLKEGLSIPVQREAAIGGTPTKAPLGYLNIRTTDSRGRESCEIELDPERAEAVIGSTYQRNSLSQAQAERVRKVLNDVFDQLEGSSEDERKLLTAQLDQLEAKRLKLVQAHYADAIPLDLLKSEQDRIRASLDQISTRLNNLTATYTEARTGFE